MILKANRLALDKHYPEWKAFLKPSLSYVPITAKNGSLSVSLNGVSLCSRYNPEKEAARHIENHLHIEMKYCLFLTMGLGYEIEAVRKAAPGLILVVHEFDSELFTFLIGHRDISRLISDPDLTLILHSEDETNLPQRRRLPAEGGYVLPLSRAWQDALSERAASFASHTINAFSRLGSNKLTLSRQHRLWISNFLVNMNFLDRAENLKICRGLYTADRGDGVALILAGGPSLPSAVKYISHHRAKLVIIAVDTAARFCWNQRIIPDFILASDAQYYNARHLQGLPPDFYKNNSLAGNLNLHPALLKLPWKRLFLYAARNPLSPVLSYPEETLPVLPSGGSVATTAFSLARFLGLKDIMTAGLDLAYSGYRAHYRGSYYDAAELSGQNRLKTRENEEWLKVPQRGIIQPGRTGTPVLTDEKLRLYGSWLERLMKAPEMKDSRVFDVTGRGLYLEGMKILAEKLPKAGSVWNPPDLPDPQYLNPSRAQAQLAEIKGQKGDAIPENIRALIKKNFFYV